MSALLAFTIAAIGSLVPYSPAHDTLAEAIAIAAEERPIFEGDDGHKTASLLVAVAWWESGQSFDCTRVGDGGHSVSCFQIWCTPRVDCARVRSDMGYAARISRDMLAESMHACRRLSKPNSLAQYTTGKCVTNRESRIRWWTHERLYRREMSS